MKFKEVCDVGPVEQVQAFVSMAKRKENLGKRRRSIYQRSNAMFVMNMGTTREIVQSSKRATIKEEGKKPISLKKWKKLKRRNPRTRK